MNFSILFDLLPRLMPLMPRIERALATIQRLENDPDIKDAIATAEAVAKILDQAQGTKQ